MSGKNRQFVGIGFGPIQSGLFLLEAQQSGCFDRMTVAEIDGTLVHAVRDSGGHCAVNVAGPRGIKKHEVGSIYMLNPCVPADRDELVRAIADADEIATALPSVNAFDVGGDAAPVSCLADGLRLRAPGAHPVAIYTAENHNHAAEILEQKIAALLPGGCLPDTVQVLNTVIGKISGTISDATEQRHLGLALLTPGISRAVLVEEFNHILITRIRLPGFTRAIAAFEEKDELLPFEEAKLYGHNAIHAVIGYLAHTRGLHNMAEAGLDVEIMRKANEAFLDESGVGLLHRYGGRDRLFTPAGFTAHAEDLLMRMTNPYLCDPIARVIRDPRRKLGWDDRLIGAMRLALQAGVQPVRLAEAAKLGFAEMHLTRDELHGIWPPAAWQNGEAATIADLIFK